MRTILTTLASAAGAGLVSVGAGMAWLPAGFIVGGLFLVAAGEAQSSHRTSSDASPPAVDDASSPTSSDGSLTPERLADLEHLARAIEAADLDLDALVDDLDPDQVVA